MDILCYGASNTWGYDPRDGSRFPQRVRWPGVLRECLGHEVGVTEEALNGRTIGSYGPAGSPYNGLEYLEAYLGKSPRFSLIILFLGTNDLFVRPGSTAAALAEMIGSGCARIRSLSPQTRLLLVPPLPLAPPAGEVPGGASRLAESCEFSRQFEGVARRDGLLFFDAAAIVRPSPVDGIHLEAAEHRHLGQELCRYVRESVALRPPGSDD